MNFLYSIDANDVRDCRIGLRTIGDRGANTNNRIRGKLGELTGEAGGGEDHVLPFKRSFVVVRMTLCVLLYYILSIVVRDKVSSS